MEHEILKTLLIGVTAVFIQKTAVYLFIAISNRLWKRGEFSVSGIWYAMFNSITEGKNNFELVKIKQRKETVRIRVLQYSNAFRHAELFYGSGIFRGGKLITNYYTINGGNNQVGVFLLKLDETITGHNFLSGGYAELEKNGDIDHIILSKNEFILKRINLPLIKRLKWVLGFPPFSTYHEALDFHRKHLSK